MAVTGAELIECLQGLLAFDCTPAEVEAALQEVLDTDTAGTVADNENGTGTVTFPDGSTCDFLKGPLGVLTVLVDGEEVGTFDPATDSEIELPPEVGQAVVTGNEDGTIGITATDTDGAVTECLTVSTQALKYCDETGFPKGGDAFLHDTDNVLSRALAAAATVPTVGTEPTPQPTSARADATYTWPADAHCPTTVRIWGGILHGEIYTVSDGNGAVDTVVSHGMDSTYSINGAAPIAWAGGGFVHQRVSTSGHPLGYGTMADFNGLWHPPGWLTLQPGDTLVISTGGTVTWSFAADGSLVRGPAYMSLITEATAITEKIQA